MCALYGRFGNRLYQKKKKNQGWQYTRFRGLVEALRAIRARAEWWKVSVELVTLLEEDLTGIEKAAPSTLSQSAAINPSRSNEPPANFRAVPSLHSPRRTYVAVYYGPAASTVIKKAHVVGHEIRRSAREMRDLRFNRDGGAAGSGGGGGINTEIDPRPRSGAVPDEEAPGVGAVVRFVYFHGKINRDRVGM